MKKLLIFASILLLFVTCKKESDNNDNCNEGFIIAGDSLNSCCEIFKIDTTFDYDWLYKIDLDNDGIFDLSFMSFHSTPTHYDVTIGCRLESENPLLEFSVKNGSGSARFISIKNAGDTIGLNDSWFANEDGKIYLSKLRYLYQDDPSGGGNNYISIYDSANIDVRNKYIGIRIKEPSFTNYYWIKFSVKFSIEDRNSLFIEEFGRQKR